MVATRFLKLFLLKTYPYFSFRYISTRLAPPDSQNTAVNRYAGLFIDIGKTAVVETGGLLRPFDNNHLHYPAKNRCSHAIVW